MAILRSERTYPLSLKSATQYALNAGITAAYDYQGDPANGYAGGDGAPHVGAKSYTKPTPAPLLVQVATGIYGRDPSVGKTSTACYTGVNMLDLGIGSTDGKGAFTIHKRLRTPSAMVSSSARTVHVIRSASGALTLYMNGTTGGYFYFRWECSGTLVPSADVPAIRVAPNTLVDLHLTRSGDLLTVYLNGTAVGSTSIPTLTTFNTAWGGLASGTNNGLNGAPADDLILVDETYWSRALSAGEVVQHQSDPYAGYANTAIVADGVTVTNPFANATINNEGATIAGYYSGATVPTGIEYRFNGGSWTALTNVTIGGGAFSGTTGPLAAATGLLDVRFANATSISTSVANVTAAVPLPTVTITSQPGPGGQEQSFAFATTRATSVAVTLTAAGSGAITQGPTSFAVTSNAASGTFLGVPPGDYTVAITVTGPGGTATIAGNAFSILGAGGGGALVVDGSVIAPPVVTTITGVTISPTSVTLAGGATQQFTAAAQGTNSPPQTFNWSNGAGVVSIAGLFTAPAAILVEQVIPVTATSSVDPRWSATAIVTVSALPPPTIDPANLIPLTGDPVTLQQNTSSGGAVKLNAHFTSDPAPRERTIYL